MTSLYKVLTAIKVPLILIMYASTWLILQSLMIKLAVMLGSLIGDVIAVVIYLMINGLWLLSWYKLTKFMRLRYINKER